jgi:hypothetical protein
MFYIEKEKQEGLKGFGVIQQLQHGWSYVTKTLFEKFKKTKKERKKILVYFT